MALDDPEHFTAFAERYAGQPRPAHIQWNDVIAGLLRHRSVRAYLPGALPENTVDRLREALGKRGFPLI